MIGLAGNALGAWGKPPDVVAWVALALAALFGFHALSRRPEGAELPAWLRDGQGGLSRRRFLAVASFAAAFASLGYIAFYLRGGPRIVDATSYFLQGRALAHGNVSWPVFEPTAAFRGRFLLFQEPNRLSGIFPPGYPFLLALGFCIGAPMVVGPLLAAGIVVATYYLAREIALAERSSAADAPSVEATARFAALLSLFCATLRYHTADTMSHGASALAIALAMATGLRAVRTEKPWVFVLTGLAVSYVAMTRMVSALPIAAVVVFLASRSARTPRIRALASFALGALPGLAFLLCAQHAATGQWFTSTQLAYYATSDGPPGCFRYGLGPGIGCLVEHGDFVRARLAHGYGLVEAAATTLRRLWLHTADVVNFEPLFLLLLLPVARAVRANRACRVIALAVGLQIVAYAPFYFDGNYPGGGARFFADVLPLEHAVIAYALGATLPLLAGAAHAARGAAFVRRIFAVLSSAALGFAIHGAYAHRALAERDGGRPMYEPDLAREAGANQGLIYFDTDHGFNLAYDPTLSASHGILAVRRRHDDRDRFLYDLLGHPTSHLYKFAPVGGGASTIETWIPPAIVGDAYRFEAEAEWPPFAQGGGYCQPIFVAGTGSSEDRVLELVPEGKDAAWAEIELPMPTSALPIRSPAAQRDRRDTFVIEPRVLLRGTGGKGTLVLKCADDAQAHGGGHPVRVEKARWEWSDEARPAGVIAKKAGDILDLPSRTIALGEAELAPAASTKIGGATESGVTVGCRMVLGAQDGAVGLDKTTVKAHR